MSTLSSVGATAPQSGQSTSIVQIAMAKSHGAYSRVFCIGSVPRAHHFPPGSGERVACIPVKRYKSARGAQKDLKGLLRPLRAL